jgi:serine/threonine protein kinase
VCVSYKGRDPWTALPILAKPSNLPLNEFIEQQRTVMYNAPLDAVTSRILPSYRLLAYRWALHIADGLTFVHAHDVIFGDLDLSQCWLSSDADLSLSLAGFVHASFKYRARWDRVIPAYRTNPNGFHPLEHQREATKQTDIFLFGCVLYQIMTGFWPATQSELSGWQQEASLILQQAWPLLEEEYMGEIVHKCWNNKFTSTEQLKAAIAFFLQC